MNSDVITRNILGIERKQETQSLLKQTSVWTTATYSKFCSCGFTYVPKGVSRSFPRSQNSLEMCRFEDMDWLTFSTNLCCRNESQQNETWIFALKCCTSML